MARLVLCSVVGTAVASPVAPPGLPSKYVVGNDRRTLSIYSRDREYDCKYHGDETQTCKDVQGSAHGRGSFQCGQCSARYGTDGYGSTAELCSKDGMTVAITNYKDHKCQESMQITGDDPYVQRGFAKQGDYFHESKTFLGFYPGTSSSSPLCIVHSGSGSVPCGQGNIGPFGVIELKRSEPALQCSKSMPPATICVDIQNPDDPGAPPIKCPVAGQPGPCPRNCDVVTKGAEKLCKSQYWMEIQNAAAKVAVTNTTDALMV